MALYKFVDYIDRLHSNDLTLTTGNLLDQNLDDSYVNMLEPALERDSVSRLFSYVITKLVIWERALYYY